MSPWRRNQWVLLQALAVLMLAFPTQGKDRLNALQDSVASIVRQGIEAQAFPGCVIYAATSREVLLHSAYGHYTYDSLQAVQKNTLYDLASVTKIHAAGLALMHLYEEGCFRLDEPIENYLDGLGDLGCSTFREVMAHQAGWPPGIPFYLRILKKNRYKRNTLAEAPGGDYVYQVSDSLWLHKDFYQRHIKKEIRKTDFLKVKDYKYSGLFFYLVPELVEALSGEPYESFLSRHFYKPLSLEATMFNPLGTFSKSRIAPTEVDTFFRYDTLQGVVHDEGAILMEGVSGNAGLFSTAEETARISRMLLSSLKGHGPLKPQTVHLFTSAQYPSMGNHRGLVFDKPKLEGEENICSHRASYRSFGHSGFTGTFVWADPDHDLVFVFLSNRVYPTRENRALYELDIRQRIHSQLYGYVRTNS
jgi:CubicO group peptidase (beta-lactamase class C family)